MSPNAYLIPVGIVFYLAITGFRLLTSPTRSIPGPFLARFTKLWHFINFRNGSFEQVAISLHRDYKSPIVRYGPNHYSISDPTALRQIYSFSNGFDKSPRYAAWSLPGKAMLFTEPREDVHRQMRRKYQDMYSVSSMMKYESVVESCVELFCERIGKFAESGEQANLARWMLCYAADTVSLMTWSARFAYLDGGEDVHGLLNAVHEIIAYAANVGIFHGWHAWIFWMREVCRKVGIGKGAQRAALVRWIAQRLFDRRQLREANSTAVGSSRTKAETDMLDEFLDANERSPDKLDESRIYDGLTGNIVAGSDTTAIALCSIIYHLAQHRSCMEKLRTEIDTTNKHRPTSPTFRQIQELPYLQVVIQEALPIHPPVGSHLERVVPAGGLEVAGHHLPPGTVVGANAWAVHRNASIFGKDVDEFRPERWLEADAEQLTKMKRNFMAFGLGSRLCLGKNLSMLEISKLVPELISRFDFELDATQPAKTNNIWFVFFKDLKVRVSKRPR